MPTCPVETADGPCGSPHDTWGGVGMHMCKMSDEAHDQWGTKDGALVWLAQEGHMVPDDDPDVEDTSAEHVESDTSENVSFPENPEADDGDDLDTSEENTSDTPDCLDCGMSLRDVADEDVVDAESGPRLVTEADYFCEDCEVGYAQ